jgi:hypothetical protein
MCRTQVDECRSATQATEQRHAGLRSEFLTQSGNVGYYYRSLPATGWTPAPVVQWIIPGADHLFGEEPTRYERNNTAAEGGAAAGAGGRR